MDNIFYSRGRIRDYARALNRLKKAYDKKDECPLALQIGETAAFLSNFIEDSVFPEELKEKNKKEIYNSLKSNGICASSILFIQSGKKHVQIAITMWRIKKGTVSAKDVANMLSEIMGKEYEVSLNSKKIISKEMADYLFEEKTKFFTLSGQVACNKDFARISGDTFSFMNTDGGKFIFFLADGMGCGETACESSTKFIELLEDLIEAGFCEMTALRLANSAFALNDDKGIPVAVDMCTIDKYDGGISFFKMGAVASFVKTKTGTRPIDSSSLPAGVLENSIPEQSYDVLSGGEYIIMMSDGVLDALPFYDKEKQMCEIIDSIEERTPEVMAKRLLNEVFFYDNRIADDMTILVVGIWERN